MTPLESAGLVGGRSRLALEHARPAARRGAAPARARRRGRRSRRRPRRRRTRRAGAAGRACGVTRETLSGCVATTIAGVALPLKPPVKPQLALSRKELPEGEEWAYEPKYDGFRAIAFVDGDDVYLQSRSGKPLLRYFPELEFPRGPVRDRRRAGDPRRRRRRGVRRAAEPHPPGRVAGADARRARRRRGSAPSTCSPRATGKLLDEPFSERREGLERWSQGSAGGRSRRRLDRADAARPQDRARRPRRGSRRARA